tara:strand:+ start:33 stop:302 length:270 start_codon:yes stop_codon:yes gene_type:complete
VSGGLQLLLFVEMLDLEATAGLRLQKFAELIACNPAIHCCRVVFSSITSRQNHTFFDSLYFAYPSRVLSEKAFGHSKNLPYLYGSSLVI